MKRILLFQFSESGWRIAAAELELLEKHLANGDKVMAVTCNGCRFACDLNLKKSKLLCWNCRNQTNRGFSAMSKEVRRHDYTEYLSAEDEVQISKIVDHANKSQEELRKVKFEAFDLGIAVVSILISRFRNPDVDPRKALEITGNLLEAGLAAYLAADHAISDYNPDKVYFFNGRGSQQRAFLRACEKHEVDYGILEEGFDLNHYEVYENATPHNIAYRNKQMRELWDSADRKLAIERGESFYEKRVQGRGGYGGMRSFTQDQEKGKLPESWNDDCHNVVIYCSSEDEFAAIGDEWKNKLYDSQLEGLKKMASSSQALPAKVKVYLRMHPNLRGLMNPFRAECEALENEQFEVILPESTISTYDLLFECDTVVSFASTVGIEATYWGKPSILLGRCFYEDLDVAYRPQSHAETMQLITAPLAPKEKEGALIYGNYWESFGIPYEMSEVGNAPTDVRFRGVHLRGNVMMRFLLALREKITGRTIEQFIGNQDQ